MSKSYYSLGLMSGTSMDGVDVSVIQSDGETEYNIIIDKYFEYPQEIYKDLTKLTDKIKSSKDLKKFSKEIKNIEEEITLFHVEIVNKIYKELKSKIDLIGFHGQTIFHDAEKKISIQLGNGKLLSKLTKKTVVYNFRQNDLKNGGQGAPLTPIFHKMLAKKLNLKNVTFINIGGIINETTISDDGYFHAADVGPGMCLIDKWIRINSKKKYDDKGRIAKAGKINEKIFNKAVRNWIYNEYANTEGRTSFDIKDFEYCFNISHSKFFKGMSLKNGAATLTEFTAETLAEKLTRYLAGAPPHHRFILCGGGRKNDFLIERISQRLPATELIDDYGIDGDFIESQAFAYLAIRSYLKLPNSFPSTTGVSKPCTGGVIVKS